MAPFVHKHLVIATKKNVCTVPQRRPGIRSLLAQRHYRTTRHVHVWNCIPPSRCQSRGLGPRLPALRLALHPTLTCCSKNHPPGSRQIHRSPAQLQAHAEYALRGEHMYATCWLARDFHLRKHNRRRWQRGQSFRALCRVRCSACPAHTSGSRKKGHLSRASLWHPCMSVLVM